MKVTTVFVDGFHDSSCTFRSHHPIPHLASPLPTPTCRGRLGMRQVTPKPTSSRFVKAKARMALVTFWICRSRFFLVSPLWRQEHMLELRDPWGRVGSPRKSGFRSHGLCTTQDSETNSSMSEGLPGLDWHSEHSHCTLLTECEPLWRGRL